MYDENELRHYGILGMKWGIRRFQNRDGTLTNLGKKRYSEDGDVGESDQTKPTVKNSKTYARSSSKEMSTEELRDAVNRMMLEKQYNQLVSDLNPKKQHKAVKFVADVLATAGKDVAIQATKYAMGKAVNNIAGADIVNIKKDKQKDK